MVSLPRSLRADASRSDHDVRHAGAVRTTRTLEKNYQMASRGCLVGCCLITAYHGVPCYYSDKYVNQRLYIHL